MGAEYNRKQNKIVSPLATQFDTDTNLIKDLRQYIEQARQRVAQTVNSEITLMYWHIGERINRDILGNQRAEYGRQIESTLSTKLSWSHFVEVLPLKDSLAKEFYITMAASEKWSIRTFRDKIDGMLYERTAISGKPDEFIKTELANLSDNDVLTPDLVFKSPYFLEFTGLREMYSEKSLEDSLVARLEQFILELGFGFTFVERQKRMAIDGADFYLDLLFYHRKLHRLIAIDLKLGKFKAQYKRQMELYLRWLEKNEMEQGEETPLGLLLCTKGGEEQIELLQLDKNGIRIAQYMTELPSRALLQKQLQKWLTETKNNLIKRVGLNNTA